MSDSNTQINCAFEADNYLGETPVWAADESALYWVNCEQPSSLHRWSPETGAHDTWPMPDRIGGLVLKESGGALIVLADGLYDFDPAAGALEKRVASPLPPHVKLHECQCDRQGRFWVGAYDHHFSPTNRDSKGGAVFRLDGDVLTPVIKDVSVSNGMAFSPDGRTMYIADAPTRRVDAYDLDPETGGLSNGREFVQLKDGEGYVDGATVDMDGYYWLAAVGAGQLRRYAPDGTLDQIVQLPCSNPTKPAFGGAELDVIYVTTTKLPIVIPGVGGAELNGDLYAVRTGAKGLVDAKLAE